MPEIPKEKALDSTVALRRGVFGGGSGLAIFSNHASGSVPIACRLAHAYRAPLM